jgi:hypothetical protein
MNVHYCKTNYRFDDKTVSKEAAQEKQYGDWTAVYGSVTTFLGLESVSVYVVPYFDAIRRCLRQVDTVSYVQLV